MAIAAVPGYLGSNFSSASPGARFGLYLKLWGTNNRTGEKLWTTSDINYRVAGRDRQERAFRDENKTNALGDALKLTAADQATLTALIRRQASLADPLEAAGQLLRLETLSVAPFATGLGNEHPLENGFAFLNPYGLPYLAGSGVKGVLRQAARELAGGEWGAHQGWDATAITALFGREGEDREADHQRGALQFWDVFPRIKGDGLVVEIMTAHQTHYYQQQQSPHESGSPNPIPFVTVPPGSGFNFYVQCDVPFLQRLAPELAQDGHWKLLMEAAFKHAFAWLGFGAKTAIGYGQMKKDAAAKKQREEDLRIAQLEAMAAETKAREEQAEAERQTRLANMTPEQKILEQIRSLLDHEKKIERKLAGGELTGTLTQALKQAQTEWTGPVCVQLAHLAEEVYGYIGWGSGAKKRERKELIQAIRGRSK